MQVIFMSPSLKSNLRLQLHLQLNQHLVPPRDDPRKRFLVTLQVGVFDLEFNDLFIPEEWAFWVNTKVRG